jgi:hypothetical protein
VGLLLRAIEANAHHCVVLLCTSLGIRLPRHAKSLTHIFEDGFINLATACDDFKRSTSAVDKCGDLLGSLIPARCGGTTVESFNRNNSSVGCHGGPIDKCLVVECIACLFE